MIRAALPRMAVLSVARSLGLQEGKYPVWYPCSPQTQNGTVLTCGGHAPDATLKGFHPYETCATMHNGWFCKGDGVGGRNTYWSAAEIWVTKPSLPTAAALLCCRAQLPQHNFCMTRNGPSQKDQQVSCSFSKGAW